MKVLNFYIIANINLIRDNDNDSRKGELKAPRKGLRESENAYNGEFPANFKNLYRN